ncbi:hypothetical protein [Streptomyces sp. NPDC001450]
MGMKDKSSKIGQSKEKAGQQGQPQRGQQERAQQPQRGQQQRGQQPERQNYRDIQDTEREMQDRLDQDYDA